jgi:hypothetical protein
MTLLNDVCGLMCHGVQIWSAAKRDIVAHRVRLGADGVACRGCSPADMCRHLADIVMAKGPLKELTIWKISTTPSNAMLRSLSGGRVRLGRPRLQGRCSGYVGGPLVLNDGASRR